MTSIFVLSLRALTRGRRPLVVAVLLAFAPLLALAYTESEAHPDGARFAVQLVDQLLIPIVFPLTALLFATSTLGGEIEDGTLLYLTLRPVSRLTLVVAKLLAATLVSAALVEAAIAITYAIASAGSYDAGLVLALLAAGAAGCSVYCAAFLTLGAFLPRRGLIVGFVYVLGWEGAAAGLSPALAALSLRRYVRSVLHAGLADSRLGRLLHDTVGGADALLIVALVVLAAIAVATARVRVLELR